MRPTKLTPDKKPPQPVPVLARFDPVERLAGGRLLLDRCIQVQQRGRAGHAPEIVGNNDHVGADICVLRVGDRQRRSGRAR